MRIGRGRGRRTAAAPTRVARGRGRSGGTALRLRAVRTTRSREYAEVAFALSARAFALSARRRMGSQACVARPRRRPFAGWPPPCSISAFRRRRSRGCMPADRAACRGACFAPGKATPAYGLLRDCIAPIMLGAEDRVGSTTLLPKVAARLVAACKAANSRFGQPHGGEARRTARLGAPPAAGNKEMPCAQPAGVRHRSL